MNNPFFFPTDHPHRARPAEHYPWPLGWVQDHRKRQRVKPHYHWMWPKDGKRGSKMGRFKDILQNKGPDIWLAVSDDKRDYMFNRPSKARWSGHRHLDDRGHDTGEIGFNPLPPGRQYDFRRRKYGPPRANMWTDAIWQPEPNKHNVFPEAFRDVNGNWWQDPRYLPGHLGGPINNPRGVDLEAFGVPPWVPDLFR